MSKYADFVLYAFWRTASTHRVRIALNFKGLTAQERFVDLDKNEQRNPDFLAINSLGAVPALIEEGYPPLTQSLAILEFLDEKFPNPPLLPSDLHGRARVRSIAAMLATDVNPLLTPRIKKYLTSAGGFDETAWQEWQIHWLTFNLQAVERRLATESETGRFCHGDAPTIADICLVSLATKAFDIKIEGIPVIERIVKNCVALDEFARAHPFLQEGAPLN
ncbi:maleylacetoacetate isomerase [Caballeronia sp.]|uniref:maleylacetoacetate isomerase n=1 Tax=Caballeronia sp. TaxID=1931223 RepID=UPI003C3EB5D6